MSTACRRVTSPPATRRPSTAPSSASSRTRRSSRRSSFSFDTLSNRLRELAFLNKGLKIVIEDERDERSHTFLYKGGIIEFIKHLNQNKTPIHPKVLFFEGKKDGIEVEVALQYNDGYQENVFSFANNINTREGGTHLTGFRAALTGTLSNYAQAQGFLKTFKGAVTGDDVREGLTAVVSVRIPDPQFEGQTKAKLGNSEVKGLVQQIVNDRLAEVVRGRSDDGAEDRRQVRAGGAGARGGAQGARADPQGRARRRGAVRQARRLLGARAAVPRDLPRRGRFRGRLRQAGPRPEDAGRAAAARQDHQCREGALRQGPLPPGDPAPHLGPRNGHRAGRVRRRQAPLPQGHPDDGRRRGRRPHPHAAAHVLLPAHGAGDRGGPSVHRAAAAVQDQEGPRGAVRDERAGDGGIPPRAVGGEGERQGARQGPAAQGGQPARDPQARARVPDTVRQVLPPRHPRGHPGWASPEEVQGDQARGGRRRDRRGGQRGRGGGAGVERPGGGRRQWR